MKTINRWMLVALLGMPVLANAQGGHVGGGDPSAADFQNYINKIDAYLLTAEGRKEFPELKQPEFHNLILRVKPVVKNERVYDSFGVAQACVSHVEKGNRYFQCDVARLPKIELNNQPTFYRITFHELLFQAGLELPISKNIPSDFKISSRLKLRLETYQEWVPGKVNELKKTSAKMRTVYDPQDIECDKSNSFLRFGSPELKIYADGDLIFSQRESGLWGDDNTDYRFDRCNVIVGIATAFGQKIIVNRGERVVEEVIRVNNLKSAYSVSLNDLECDHDSGMHTNRAQIYYKGEIIFTATSGGIYKYTNADYSYDKCREILEQAEILGKNYLRFDPAAGDIWRALQ